LNETPRRLVVAITGASGAVYGVRLLEHLRALRAVETHLVLSPAGVLNIHQELGRKRGDVEALADVVHAPADIGAPIASGSFPTVGMVIAPCSAKTLAAVALLVRETPLNLAHIRNMEAVTLMGGVIFPPVPAFYQRPRNLDDLVDHTLARVLDQFGIAHRLAPAWPGMSSPPSE